MRPSFLPLLLALIPLAPVVAQDDPAGFVITGARVFDGTQVLEGKLVVVRDGVIEAVEDAAGFDVPADLLLIDGSGHTLLPGLIDSHTHPWGRAQLRQALAFGVTTELSMMNQPALAKSVRDAEAKGEASGLADMRGAGNPVTVAGGHGTQFGFPVPTVSAVDEIEAFVAARVEEGSDFIKIMYEHGTLYGWEMPGLDATMLEAAVQAAHGQNRLAVVHVSTWFEGRAAFEAGADGLVHVWMDQEPDLDGLSALRPDHPRPFVIPTLTVVEGLLRRPGDAAPLAQVEAFEPFFTPADQSNLRRSWVGLDLGADNLDAARHSVALLRLAGFPILAGSDAPNPGVVHGASLHRELELLVSSGLSPLEALQAATSAPAEAFGLDDRGRIAPGLRADLLLVAGDPADRVTATRAIARVWKAGVEFDRAVYLAEVAAARERLAKIPAPANLTQGPAADFEDGKVGARFGSFMPTTDAIRGGTSSVRLTLVEGGPGESVHCLRLDGTVTEKAPLFRWSATLFSPSFPMTPANLSAASGIRLWVRGQGPIFLGVMAQRLGPLPVVRKLEVSDEWREVRFSWAELDGLDGADVSGIMLGADKPGEFWLEVDELTFD